MKVTAKAYAKLNLTLDVSKKRADGYHDIESVFQSVSLCDTLTVQSTAKDINIYTASPIDKESNICFKAAQLFFKETKITGGADITLNKSIPIAAGLGGGSADGAATLKALNTVYGKPLSDEALQKLSARLGADVPFCLFGGTAYAAGIGDRLRRLCDLPDCDIIIIKNAKKPSTAALYSMLDNRDILRRPDTAAALLAIEVGDLKAACNSFYNVFMEVWGNNLLEVTDALTAEGAIVARLSGSGPSVFGIFEKGRGERAYNKLRNKFSDIYLCAPKAAPGVEIFE